MKVEIEDKPVASDDRDALNEMLVGKTIVAVETPSADGSLDFEYGANLVVLVFADGTRVAMNPTGYECDGIEFEEVQR